jgi:SAM-dependent methyltransferase
MVPGDPGTMAEAVWESLPPEAGIGPGAAARRRFLLTRVRPDDRVLDLGCGLGDDLAALRDAGVTAIGVDVAPTALERAGERHSGLDLRLAEPGKPLPLEDGTVDVVWASEVIEHVVDVTAWLSEVRRVLAPGGRLLLTTPYHGRVQAAIVSLTRFESHFHPLSDHVRFLTRRSLGALLDAFGFDDVRITTIGAIPLLHRTLLAEGRRAGWNTGAAR